MTRENKYKRPHYQVPENYFSNLRVELSEYGGSTSKRTWRPILYSAAAVIIAALMFIPLFEKEDQEMNQDDIELYAEYLLLTEPEFIEMNYDNQAVEELDEVQLEIDPSYFEYDDDMNALILY